MKVVSVVSRPRLVHGSLVLYLPSSASRVLGLVSSRDLWICLEDGGIAVYPRRVYGVCRRIRASVASTSRGRLYFRIVLPFELVRVAGIKPGTDLVITVAGGRVVVAPAGTQLQALGKGEPDPLS